MTPTIDKRFERLFKQAAWSALVAWRNDIAGYEDLAHDLWVKVLESPGTQRKLAELNNNQLVATLKKMAFQILSDDQGELNVFRSEVMYSSDSVKEALSGKSTNWYLIALLPDALKKLADRNQDYADAIESRYKDKKIPVSRSKEQVQLSRAVKSLTEHVNALCISGTERDSDDKLRAKDGPGSRTSGKLFPQDRSEDAGQPADVRRRSKGTHSDPTAAQALSIVAHPEIRDELVTEESILEFTKGPNAVFKLPDGRGYRLSNSEARQVREHPERIFDIVKEVLDRVC